MKNTSPLNRNPPNKKLGGRVMIVDALREQTAPRPTEPGSRTWQAACHCRAFSQQPGGKACPKTSQWRSLLPQRSVLSLLVMTPASLKHANYHFGSNRQNVYQNGARLVSFNVGLIWEESLSHLCSLLHKVWREKTSNLRASTLDELISHLAALNLQKYSATCSACLGVKLRWPGG